MTTWPRPKTPPDTHNRAAEDPSQGPQLRLLMSGISFKKHLTKDTPYAIIAKLPKTAGTNLNPAEVRRICFLRIFLLFGRKIFLFYSEVKIMPNAKVLESKKAVVANLSGKSEELCARIVSSLILSKHIDLNRNIMLF